MLQSRRRTWTCSKAVVTLAIVAVASIGISSVAAAQDIPPQINNPFPKMPEGVVPRFDLRDSRALDMLQYMHCMNETVGAAKQGRLGTVPSSALIVCVRQPEEWRGVAGQLSADRQDFRILSQLSLRNRARTTESVDTATAAALARALLRGAATAERGGTRYSFTAVPLKFETFIEVWFMPVQNSATQMLVGGDSLIQMTTDGKREQGHFEKSPKIRELSMPSGQSYVIESVEDDIPLVSELLAARLALTRVHEVRIRTKKFESVISNTTRKWLHAPRRG